MSITAERLKELYLYNPEDGTFTRIKAAGRHNRWGVGTIANHHDPITGYNRIRIDGTLYSAHRLAWLYMTGSWPTHQIDHVDLDRANNAWRNLREAGGRR